MDKSTSGGNKYHFGMPGYGPFFSATYIVLGLAALLVLLNLLVLYGIFLSPQGILGYRQQSRHVEELTAKVKKLNQENNRLFRKIQGLKTDPRALEKLVREQLGWAKADEMVIDFVTPANKPDTP